MNKNKIILIIIGLLIIIGSAAYLGYWFGIKLTGIGAENITPNILDSGIIKNCEAIASGTVMDKNETSITLQDEGKSMVISLRVETIFWRATIENGEKKMEQISPSDIKNGQNVNIEIAIDSTGEIWAKNITILPQ